MYSLIWERRGNIGDLEGYISSYHHVCMLFVIGYCSCLKVKKALWLWYDRKSVNRVAREYNVFLHTCTRWYLSKERAKIDQFPGTFQRNKNPSWGLCQESLFTCMVLTSQLQYRSKESWHFRLETRIYRESRIGARVSRIENPGSRRSRKFSRISMTVSRKRFHSR